LQVFEPIYWQNERMTYKWLLTGTALTNPYYLLTFSQNHWRILMKKIALVTLTILTLLFSMLPLSSALAKKDGGDVKLQVKNQTGTPLTLLLIDENGNHLYFTFEPGFTGATLPEGKYSYYVSTPCGNQSGVFNVNVTKQLFFACGDDGVDTHLQVPDFQGAPGGGCGAFEWWHSGEGWGHWHPGGPFPGSEGDNWGQLCTDGVDMGFLK
jgi:hypothetical protein